MTTDEYSMVIIVGCLGLVGVICLIVGLYSSENIGRKGWVGYGCLSFGVLCLFSIYLGRCDWLPTSVANYDKICPRKPNDR